MIQAHLQVTLTVSLTVDESFRLEAELAKIESPAREVEGLRDALRTTNATASRLLSNGAAKAGA